MSDGGGVLLHDTVDEILVAQWPDVVVDQGPMVYGTGSAVGTVWGHGYSDLGVSTEFRFDPTTGVGVLILMNGDGYDPYAVAAMRICSSSPRVHSGHLDRPGTRWA